MTRTIASFIRTIPDYPKPGILFRDVTGLLEDARGLRMAVDLIVHRYIDRNIDLVAGVEARGFIFGTAEAIATETQTTSAWGSINAADQGRVRTERAAFDLLLEEIQKLMPEIVANHGG